MSDEELEQDDDLEMDATDDSDDSLEAEAADNDDGAESAGSSSRSGSGRKKSAGDGDAVPSVEAKQSERDALQRAMDEFLARGGQVQEIDSNVVSDPPKKPGNKYGSRPI